MLLPQQADYTNGAQVVLVDFPPPLEQTVTADATGTATVTFDPVDTPFLWRVERMMTFCNTSPQPAGAQLLVYADASGLPIRIRDGSASPAMDVADESSPITLQPSNQLTVKWTGLAAGTKASISVQYQLWRRIIAGGTG
jgi:hypothetical protein